jgi:hypothetical protein
MLKSKVDIRKKKYRKEKNREIKKSSHRSYLITIEEGEELLL